MFPSIKKLAAVGFALSAVAFAACAENVDLGAQPRDDGGLDNSFDPPLEDGGEVALDSGPGRPVLACMGTECSYPYATCSAKPFPKCGTNVMNDAENCGDCGKSCKAFGAINLDAVCVQGQCVFTCQLKESPGFPPATLDFRDCNQLLDDGCETEVQGDPKNCGACGNACKAGENCIRGKCGCSSGYTDCDGTCTDIRSDDSNCGACGNYCEEPADACDPKPTNTYYGCGTSKCGALKCKSGYADCNQDLGKKCASDGCETEIDKDPKNCGGCGIRCGVDQECRDEGRGPECLDTCAKMGMATCPQGCEDLVTDPYNCGGCGNGCPNPRAHQVSSCRKGLCELDCVQGWADCNNDPSDGCEVDLTTHPANCGACGNACNYGEGQPCIEGKCLMVECDGGVVTK